MRPGTLPALLAATLFAAALLLANIPGNLVIGPDVLRDDPYGAYFLCGVSEVAHGWPFTFLRHEGYAPPPGLVVSAWRIGEDPRFTSVAFIANLTLLAAGTWLIGTLVRRRIQNHGWRFGVIHVLVVMLCVSVIAAFMTSRYRTHQAQVARYERDGYRFSHTECQPFGPYWLRTITGPQCWQWGDLQVSAYLQHADEIAELPGKSKIKVLNIESIECRTMPSLDGYDDLLAINMGMANYGYANFDGDDDPPLLACLREIAECDSIQALNLYDSIVTDRGLKELSRMPNLTHLELTGNTEVTDAGLLHLGSTTTLRKLGLAGTGVSQEGVERLQARLPECEIHW